MKIPMTRRENPQCTRCGKCCLADLTAYVTPADLERWAREGRKDILHIMENEHAVWLGDHFVSSTTGRPIYGCPFLEVTGEITSCSIHDTRPEVCRNYQPGSSEICPLWYTGDKGPARQR